MGAKDFLWLAAFAFMLASRLSLSRGWDTCTSVSTNSVSAAVMADAFIVHLEPCEDV